MVTGATCHKVHFFKMDARLRFLHESLLDVAHHYGWNLQAWAVFPNHYHFIGVAPEDATSLKLMVQHLHS
jgi:putative transposase